MDKCKILIECGHRMGSSLFFIYNSVRELDMDIDNDFIIKVVKNDFHIIVEGYREFFGEPLEIQNVIVKIDSIDTAMWYTELHKKIFNKLQLRNVFYQACYIIPFEVKKMALSLEIFKFSNLSNKEKSKILEDFNFSGFSFIESEINLEAYFGLSIIPIIPFMQYPEWPSPDRIDEVIQNLNTFLREISKGQILEPQKSFENKPSIFQIPDSQIDSKSVAVLIPFSNEFNDVYNLIKEVCEEIGLIAKKADDIWDNQIIMQQIFELIYTSSIIVADVTGKNPNVFYEIGIAHTLGKRVIPIAQNENDIPFDIRHLRYLLYTTNKKGLINLKIELKKILYL